MATERTHVPRDVKLTVLIEAGYRCAVPTCRTILAIDLHHMVEVSEGGDNSPHNLLALCPTCHALYHRGIYDKEAIFAWKGMLVAISQAFDYDTIDLLMFLAKPESSNLRVDGGGVLRFARLVAAGLATFFLKIQNGPLLLYQIELTPKGTALINAWRSGKRADVAQALGGGT